MQLIQNGTQLPGGVGALPVPAAPVGTPGFANPAAPGIGVVRTVFDADVGDSLLAELYNVISGMGIALDPANRLQLLQAVRRIGRPYSTKLLASATLTPDQQGFVAVDASAGPVTVTLPSVSIAGSTTSSATASPLRYTILRVDNSAAGSVRVQGAPGQLIAVRGTAVANVLLVTGQPAELVSDAATGWTMIAGLVTEPSIWWQNTHGTYAVIAPWGISQMLVRRAHGAGGGGGGAVGAAAAGVGGASAVKIENLLVPVSPGQQIDVVVGQGGAGGIGGGAAAGPGGAGTITTIAYHATGQMIASLTGGGGGQQGDNAIATTYSTPGTGSIITGGSALIWAGVAGAPGILASSGTVLNGLGGGVDGVPNTLNVNSAGNSAAVPGAGGNGGSSSNPGGSGADGLVVLEFG